MLPNALARLGHKRHAQMLSFCAAGMDVLKASDFGADSQLWNGEGTYLWLLHTVEQTANPHFCNALHAECVAIAKVSHTSHLPCIVQESKDPYYHNGNSDPKVSCSTVFDMYYLLLLWSMVKLMLISS